jgi:hypothetical protein
MANSEFEARSRPDSTKEQANGATSNQANGETHAGPNQDANHSTPSRRSASTPAQTPTQAAAQAPLSGRGTRTRSARLAESGASAPTTRSASQQAHLASSLQASEAQAAVAALAMLHSSPHRISTVPLTDTVSIPATAVFVPSTAPVLVKSDGTTVQLDANLLEQIRLASTNSGGYDWARVMTAGASSSGTPQQSAASSFPNGLSNADAQAIAALQELGAGNGDCHRSSNGHSSNGGIGMARVLYAVPSSVSVVMNVRIIFHFLCVTWLVPGCVCHACLMYPGLYNAFLFVGRALLILSSDCFLRDCDLGACSFYVSAKACMHALHD